jgi:hypothetical protein
MSWKKHLPQPATRTIVVVTPRVRVSVAVLCVALVLVAGVLPAVAAALGPIVLVALWLVQPQAAVTIVARAASACDERPVSLLALLDPRGPPPVHPLG